MMELLKACMELASLPYTLLLTIVVFYWMTVIIGVFDLDIFPDFGGGEQVDLDVDLELGGADGADIDAGGGDADAPEVADAALWGGLPKLLGLGVVPVTVLISFFALFAWSFSLLFHHYIGTSSLIMAAGFAVPNIILSILMARVISWPFSGFFTALSRGQKVHEKLEGKTCIILTSRVDDHFGQAEIQTEGAPYLLNVRTKDGISLKKGDQGVILYFDQESDGYIVQPFEASAVTQIEDKK